MGKKIWASDEDEVGSTQTLSQQAAERDLGVRQGDVLRDNQVRHEAFDKVNKEWLLKCPTFESVIKKVSEFEKTCEDIDNVPVSELKVLNAKVIVSDQGVYELSDTAIDHLASWTNIPSSYLKFLRDQDTALFDVNANKGLERVLKLNVDKKTFLRTKIDEKVGVMRAMLSNRYAAINNLPVIEALAEVVPGGRVSHLGFNGDTFRANILIPDVMRSESDSDYGGGISALNNETGLFAFRQRPFVFRHICCNGNVWDRADGVQYSRIHKGAIDWKKFKHAMIENVQRQIPLVDSMISKVLSLKSVGLTEDEIKKSVVFLSTREMLSLPATQSWYKGFEAEQGASKDGEMLLSAFGVIQGLTRAAQDQPLQVQELMEVLSGKLIQGNWEKIVAGARTVEDKRVEKVLVEASH